MSKKKPHLEERKKYIEIEGEVRRKNVHFQIALFHEFFYLDYRDSESQKENALIISESTEAVLKFSEVVLLDAQGCESGRDFLKLMKHHPEVSVDVLLKTVLEEDCEKGLHELKEEKSEEQYKSYEGNAFAECLEAYGDQAEQMSPRRTYGRRLRLISRQTKILYKALSESPQKPFWETFNECMDKEGMGMGTLKYLLIRAKSLFAADVEQYDGAFVSQVKKFSELVQDNHPRSSHLKSALFFKKPLYDIVKYLQISHPDAVHLVHIEQNNTGSINALQGGYAHVDAIANFFPEVVREILGDRPIVLIRDGGGSFRLISFDGELKQEWVEEICNKMSEKCHKYLQQLNPQEQAKLQIDGFGRMALKDYYPHIAQKELEASTGDFFMTDYSFHHLSKEKVLLHQKQVPQGIENEKVSKDLLYSASSLLIEMKNVSRTKEGKKFAD